jgi:hypothetical protein
MRRRGEPNGSEWRWRGDKVYRSALKVHAVAAAPQVGAATQLSPAAIEPYHWVGSGRRLPEVGAGATHHSAQAQRSGDLRADACGRCRDDGEKYCNARSPE